MLMGSLGNFGRFKVLLFSGLWILSIQNLTSKTVWNHERWRDGPDKEARQQSYATFKPMDYFMVPKEENLTSAFIQTASRWRIIVIMKIQVPWVLIAAPGLISPLRIIIPR